MKYQLIEEINPSYTAIEQVLTNRGIAFEDIHRYLNTTDEDINSPLLLGEENLKTAASLLIKAIHKDENALLIVDSDCDGLTSSALFINYMHDLFPAWTESNLNFYLHSGKQHGLSDCIQEALKYSLVIIPDAGSNDYEYHKELTDAGIPVIVMDHHEADKISIDAVIINNQLSDYPNKNFSGVGITWQFCRYLDSLMKKDYANRYLDLVALGNMADMMDIREIETKHLIANGFKDENVHNPFIRGMADKNAFSIGSKITPMGAAFYIAPFVNAMVRSGTQEEKQLLFRSMINYQAGLKIPSTKRGHKLGEEETILEQALRTATNVKNRQTRVQDASLELLEKLIEQRGLMNHQVLLFLLEPGQVDRNVAGLIANKFMAKYQRPVCMLTKVRETIEHIDHVDDKEYVVLEDKISYQGSARGCDLAGVRNFKDICENTGLVDYAQGHQGAFGISIPEEDISAFLKATDAALVNMSQEPIYYVDYIFEGSSIKSQYILDIASLEDLWGQGLTEPFVAIKNLRISKDMVTVYRKKDNTLKITLPNKVCIMLFKASDELCDKLQNQNPGYIAFDIVGKCKINEWMGFRTPQIFIEDYVEIGQNKYDF